MKKLVFCLVFLFIFPSYLLADPILDIKANALDGPVTIALGDPLSVRVNLDSDNLLGEDADWWMLAKTPSGWSHYNRTLGWQPGKSFVFQRALFDLDSQRVPNISNMEIGKYTYYFGVDMVMDGFITKNDAYYDRVVVNIRPITFETTFGGADDDLGGSVQQTTDGGFVIAGLTESYGVGGQDVYLIKTDADGSMLWQKTFGGADDEYGHSIQQTTDGGFVISGTTQSYGTGDHDVYLIKTDADGSMLWQKTFGGVEFDEGNGVQQTTDGGFVITGGTGEYVDPDEYDDVYSSDVYLIKTDTDGNMLWEKTFGGANYKYGVSVQQTTDGGFVIAGLNEVTNADDSLVLLIKTDADGNSLWEKTFGGANADMGYSVQQTTDGGFVITGETYSYGAGNNDVYLIKTDADGNGLWEKTFGGAGQDYGYSVQQTTDGGFVITGYTDSYGAGDYDVYLIKTDADGNSLWEKTFGGISYDRGNSVQQTTDGGFVITGWTSSYGAGSYDVYLIKTDANGDVQ